MRHGGDLHLISARANPLEPMARIFGAELLISAPRVAGLLKGGSAELGQPALSPEAIADMSIHIAPKAWPSGSARSRVYMKP